MTDFSHLWLLFCIPTVSECRCSAFVCCMQNILNASLCCFFNVCYTGPLDLNRILNVPIALTFRPDLPGAHRSLPDLLVGWGRVTPVHFFPCLNSVSISALWHLAHGIPSLSLSILTAIFPGEPRLSGFILHPGDGRSDNSWSYMRCKAPVKSLPPTDQHQTFLQTGCPSCRPTTASKHSRET